LLPNASGFVYCGSDSGVNLRSSVLLHTRQLDVQGDTNARMAQPPKEAFSFHHRRSRPVVVNDHHRTTSA
jgi:hypothetical protein